MIQEYLRIALKNFLIFYYLIYSHHLRIFFLILKIFYDKIKDYFNTNSTKYNEIILFSYYYFRYIIFEK